MRFQFVRLITISLVLFLTQTVLAEDGKVEPAVAAIAKQPINISNENIGKKYSLVLRTSMQNGEPTGKVQIKSFFSCGTAFPSYFNQQVWTGIQFFLNRDINSAFEKSGYVIFKADESAFGDQNSASADFKIGATLKDFQRVGCGNFTNSDGSIYVKIFWELFSSSQQKVIYTATTEGNFNSQASIPFNDLLTNAIKNATNNLLAKQDFVDMYLGKNAAAQTEAKSTPLISLISSNPPAGGVIKNTDALLNAVVTIENSGISGSGFYIDNSGYLLTNSHVVLSEKYVRVRTSNGDTLVGEVIKRDDARDVALVKTNAVNFAAFTIRKTPTNVADEVYALGSPRGKNFSGTLTKGILSPNRTIENVNYLQSDVSVSAGSSGGPLLDASGAVVGISKAMIDGTALHFFVPINEALSKLSIELK